MNKLDDLIDRLSMHIAQMAPHQTERRQGRLLKESWVMLKMLARLERANISPYRHHSTNTGGITPYNQGFHPEEELKP